MAGRFELNEQGVRELLRDADLAKDLHARADRISETAGGAAVGFMSEDSSGERARARVTALTWHAQRAERKDRRLSRAVEAGRGNR